MDSIKNIITTTKLPNDFGSTGIAKTTNDSQTDDKTPKYDATAQLAAILEVMPPRYKDLKPDYELYKQLSAKSLLLTGAVGSGKTRKLLEIMIAHLLDTYSKRYTDIFYESGFIKVEKSTIEKSFLSVPMVLFKLKEEFDTSRTGASLLNQMIKTPVLFLDDLGVEKASEWVKEQLYMVINERYNWIRPIVLTTNLTIREIAEHYGDRMASRLVEMCQTINYGGNDNRIIKRSQA